MKTKNSNTQRIIERFKITDFIEIQEPNDMGESSYIFDKPKFEQWLASELEGLEEKIVKDTEGRFIRLFMNTNYDGGVDKPNNEYWHYFFEDTVWKRFDYIFKKIKSELSTKRKEGKK